MNKKADKLIYNEAKPSAFCNRQSTKMGTLTLSVLIALSPNFAYAQSHIKIYADGHQDFRPTLLQAHNGIPIVNIRSINDKGVSRNEFGYFNVDDKGVVLNNAPSSIDSQLTGQIDGNFWLVNGEASTIVNEIYHPNPTKIEGKIEIAGQNANIIIANPNGITINGGGFINANNSILTTGDVVYDTACPSDYR